MEHPVWPKTDDDGGVDELRSAARTVVADVTVAIASVVHE
jgi:hypothetical protein